MEGLERRLKSYVRALQLARPAGFKVVGAQAWVLRDWIVPGFSGEKPARTPSRTSVFTLIRRHLRAAQEFARVSEPDVDPRDEPALEGHLVVPKVQPGRINRQIRGRGRMVCGPLVFRA